MRQSTARSGEPMERKIISVSVRRQLTIPQKYYDALGFDNEAECILQDGGLFIRPVHSVGSEFSEQILADLISQGYGGQDLLLKFKEYNRAVRPAVRKLIDEADAYAKSGEGRVPLGELFETEE